MVFTHGKIEKQRFVLRRGLPPWKRVYGFRSDLAVQEELQNWFPGKEFVDAQLIKESFYHGDTAFCSFGPGHGYLLAYLPAVSEPSRARLRQVFKERLIEISDQDAAIYAANSFYFEVEGKKMLVMPLGVSEPLIRAVEKHGVEPVLVDVSEFLLKGGGSVKCMIGSLGILPPPTNETVREVRARHLYLS
jgi:N-dimethylarginine dimethylaminohydrolase